MTPRDRVLSVLVGEKPDRVPFIIWNNKLPTPEIERRLLELGACVIVKSTVWHGQLDGIDVRREPLSPTADGHARTRMVYRTPVGEVSEIYVSMPGTAWCEKHLFETAADYDALESLLHARRYTPAFDLFRADDTRYPGACLARPCTVHSPMHEVIYELMGIETFCLELTDNRERVLRLVELMAADVDRRVQLMAESPAQICVIDGNTEISVVGLPLYREFYLPHIDRACRTLHAAGKYAGAHLDGNNRLVVNEVAGTALDFIESFTPPPDCDLPLRDARRAWPEKTIMSNLPSALHHQGAEAVRGHARAMLAEGAGDGRRLIVSASEDLPGRGLETLVPLAEEVAVWKPGEKGMNREETLLSNAHHTVLFHDPAKWAAVPANNGGNGPIWQWSGELLVGFTVGTFARADSGHQCTNDKPFDSWLARSRDGGETWQTYTPVGYQGQQGFRTEDAIPLPEAVDFTSPGFVMRVEGDGYHGNGGRQWFHSLDKGVTWKGPYTFGALLDHPELAGRNLTARTAYIVNGPRDCFLFLSVGPAFSDKVFLARTTDGGTSFRFVSWVVPATDPFRAVMPAPVRVSAKKLVVAVRRRVPSDEPCWIDGYQSEDNGGTWTFLSKIGETGRWNGNPPAMIGLSDGRLCCVYGNRDRRVMIARFSADTGKTWGPELVLRDGFQSANGSPDLGYPRLFQRPGGKLVAVYFWCTPERPETHIEATIFQA